MFSEWVNARMNTIFSIINHHPAFILSPLLAYGYCTFLFFLPTLRKSVNLLYSLEPITDGLLLWFGCKVSPQDSPINAWTLVSKMITLWELEPNWSTLVWWSNWIASEGRWDVAGGGRLSPLQSLPLSSLSPSLYFLATKREAVLFPQEGLPQSGPRTME